MWYFLLVILLYLHNDFQLLNLK